MNCASCAWAHPDTCRSCRAEEAERRANEREYQSQMSNLSTFTRYKPSLLDKLRRIK